MSGQQDRWEQLDRWDQHDPRDAVTVDLSRLIERVQLELRADGHGNSGSGNSGSGSNGRSHAAAPNPGPVRYLATDAAAQRDLAARAAAAKLRDAGQQAADSDPPGHSTGDQAERSLSPPPGTGQEPPHPPAQPPQQRPPDNQQADPPPAAPGQPEEAGRGPAEQPTEPAQRGSAEPDAGQASGRNDRPAGEPDPGSLADLRRRLESLPAGHPSSPFHADGGRRSPPLRLKHLELAPPRRDRPGSGTAGLSSPDLPSLSGNGSRSADAVPDWRVPRVGPEATLTGHNRASVGPGREYSRESSSADSNGDRASATSAGLPPIRGYGATEPNGDATAEPTGTATAEPARPATTEPTRPATTEPTRPATAGPTGTATTGPTGTADRIAAPWPNGPATAGKDAVSGLAATGPIGSADSIASAGPTDSASRIASAGPTGTGSAGRIASAGPTGTVSESRNTSGYGTVSGAPIARTEADGSWNWGSASLTPQQVGIAQEMHDRFRVAEGRNLFGSYGGSGVTATLRRVEAQLEHGRLAPDTEQYALLDRDRFMAGLAGLIKRRPGQPVEQLARQVTGALSYTFVFDAASYSAGTWLVHDALRSQGFQLEARKNDWNSTMNRCVVSIWLDPVHHLPVQVRFHTTASHEAQQLMRTSATMISNPRIPAAEAAKLRADVAAAWAALSAPPGSSEIGDYRRER